MAEPPGLAEDLELTCRSELVDLHDHRLFEISEIALGLLPAEEVVRGGAATGGELVGHFAANQLEGGQPEAGLFLGETVEGPDPVGREDPEQTVAGGVDDEGLPPSPAQPSEIGRRIVQEPPDPVDPARAPPSAGGHRMDLGQRPAGHRMRLPRGDAARSWTASGSPAAPPSDTKGGTVE